MRKEMYWADPRFKGIVPFESKVCSLTCDFTRANKILRNERKKEKEYLEKCFAID